MSQNRSSTIHGDLGFTLVELLVIAPIALLIITGFIAVMVGMVSDSIISHTRNTLTHDIQGALNMIEQDVRLSVQFPATSGTLPSPQGKGGGTAAFTSASGDLILGEVATDKNPLDPMREFIHYNTPYSCSDTAQVYKNRIFFTTVIYFVKDGSLWRRSYVPSPSGTLCKQAWQVNSCEPDFPASASRCKTNDIEVMQNVKTFSVTYYNKPGDTTPVASAGIPVASTIRVMIEGQREAAGRTLTTSSATRISKLDEKDIEQAPPAAPNVTASVSDRTVNFSWAAVPSATSYIVQYNINGGDWVVAAESTDKTAFSVDAYRGDSVTAKVSARNTTGTSTDTSANVKTIQIPVWTECSLQNGWVRYHSVYSPCAYTITKSGVVMLKGMIKNGATTANITLFTLPPGYRPAPSSSELIFQTVVYPNQPARIDITREGVVQLNQPGSSNSWLSLDGIAFIPSWSLYAWTSLTPLNGWSNYSGLAPLQTTKDSIGRVHVQGTLNQGTYTTGTPIANLPAGYAPPQYFHFPVRGSSYNLVGIDSGGSILARGISTSYYSIQVMYYPGSAGDWTNFTPISGAPTNGRLGNGWTTYSSTYATPQFTKSADNVVTVKGLVKGGTVTNGTVIAVLPPGYRPTERLLLPTTLSSGAGRIDVSANGEIIAVAVDATWTAMNFSFAVEP